MHAVNAPPGSPSAAVPPHGPGLASPGALGHSAVQSNTVVSTNPMAVRLPRSLGCSIVATVPDGFRLPEGTTVPHDVMHRALP